MRNDWRFVGSELYARIKLNRSDGWVQFKHCRSSWNFTGRDRRTGTSIEPCFNLSLSVGVVFCCCAKKVNIWLYLPHALMDFNQSWAIDSTWEPLFVDEVKGHIKIKGHLRSSCKKSRIEVASFEKLKSDWNQTWFIDIM